MMTMTTMTVIAAAAIKFSEASISVAPLTHSHHLMHLLTHSLCLSLTWQGVFACVRVLDDPDTACPTLIKSHQEFSSTLSRNEKWGQAGIMHATMDTLLSCHTQKAGEKRKTNSTANSVRVCVTFGDGYILQQRIFDS